MNRGDMEVAEIIRFIRQELVKLKYTDRGLLKSFSEENDVGTDVLTKFQSYEDDSDPFFRTTYKILRGLLGRAPISINDPLALKLHKLKTAQERDKFGILDKILVLLVSDVDLGDLSNIIDMYYKKIDISPQKTGEGA